MSLTAKPSYQMAFYENKYKRRNEISPEGG